MTRSRHTITWALIALCLPLACLSGPRKAVAEARVEWTDQEISDAVYDELLLKPGVSPAAIDIDTEAGVVTLEGSVGSLLGKERAARIARAVKGVRAVVNRIRVAPSPFRSDGAVRTDVVRALARDPAAEAYQVEVTVEDGVVTLRGTVESLAERELAGNVVKGVHGVTGLNNAIDVVPKEARADAEIEQDIRQSLRWDIRVDHGLIDVAVEDGKAVLSGTVGSAAEKTWARYDAYVAGVTQVDTSGLEVKLWARDSQLRVAKHVFKSEGELRAAVEDALVLDPRTSVFDIAVEVHGGIVTLRGSVDNLRAKRSAGEDARNVVGVRTVRNRIKVRPRALLGSNEIKRWILDAYTADPYLNRTKVGATVVAGVAYLNGTVDTAYEKMRAEDIASGTPGVLDVENNLEVRAVEAPSFAPYLYDPYVGEYSPYAYDPTPYAGDYGARGTLRSDEEILKDIRDELFWSPFVDADQVAVSVDDGVAVLKGTVDSWAERDAATENAFDGGAVSVRNELVVSYQGPQADN